MQLQQPIKEAEKSQCSSQHNSHPKVESPSNPISAHSAMQPIPKSEFYETYIDYLSLQENKEAGSKPYQHTSKYQQRIEELLGKDKNISFYNKFVDKLQIRAIRCVRDCLQIGLSWGFIYCEVYVVRMGINGQHLHGQKIAGKGSFSTAYFTQYKKNMYITKSIPIAYNNNSESIIQSPQLTRIITEYFFSLLAGLLEVGPKIHRLFGFDIILYNDCADYVLEVCQKLSEYNGHMEDVEEDLKYGLRILHSLQICHCDIKPDNIMYCPRLKRVVYVDFGLARVVKEEIGYKSLTYFVGTYMYSGEQMRRLYILKLQKHIDMYYNDVEAVRLTLNYLEKKVSNVHEAQELLKSGGAQQSSAEKNPEDRYRQESDVKLLLGQLREPNTNKTQYLINILKIKYNTWVENYKFALELMKEEKVMLRSTMMFLVEEYSQAKNPYARILAELIQEVKAKLTKLISRYCTFDQYIAQYFAKHYTQQHIYDVLDLLRHQDTSAVSFKEALLKITTMLNPAEDPADWEDFTTRQRARQKIISSAYEHLHPGEEVQTSFLYKSHVVLLLLVSLSCKSQSQKCLQNLRQAFMKIDDYTSCLQVQNQIIRLVGETSLSWFYVIRMYYFVERRKWISSAYKYGDQVWYKQISDKRVALTHDSQLSNEQMFENMLRSVGLLILSSEFSQRGILNLRQASQKLVMILQTHPVRAELHQKLVLIQEWCQLVWGQGKRGLLQELQLKIEEAQIQQYHPRVWSQSKNRELYRQNFLKAGFANELSHISKFYVDHGTVVQFTSIVTRNNHKTQSKMLALHQIERILGDYHIVNSYAKMQLLQLYIAIIVGKDIGLVGSSCSSMMVSNIMRAFVEGMRELILVKQNHQSLNQFDLFFCQKLKQEVAKFNPNLMQILSACQHKEEIDQALLIITQSYFKYAQGGLLQFQAYLLAQSKELAQKDQNFMHNNHSGILGLLREFKLLYQMLNCMEPLLQKLILMYFHQTVKNNRLQIMLALPEIFPLVLSIEAGLTQNVLSYFKILVGLTESIPMSECPQLVNAPLEFIYRQSLTSMLFVCSPQDIECMMDDFCRKLSLHQINGNYLYSLIVAYIYAISLQLPHSYPTPDSRKRMLVLTLRGAAKIKCEYVYEEIMTFMWKQIRKLQAVGDRKNVAVLREQIRVLNQESSKKLASLCYKNIRVSKRQLSQDFDLVIRKHLENKLNKLKINIKTFDFD